MVVGRVGYVVSRVHILLGNALVCPARGLIE